MRHGASGRRSRNRGGSGGGRNNGGRGSNNRSQVFDSNGPDVRIRGTAHQINEKYVALANDAKGCGDYILSESYMQHAEHYQRVINGWQEQDDERRNRQAEYAAKQEAKETNKIENPGNQKEDLGLPSSIVGEKAKKDKLEDA